MGCMSERGTGAWGRVADIDDAWRRVERMLVRQKLQPTRGGACDAVSSRSWLGFARDWLFCLYAFSLAVECAER